MASKPAQLRAEASIQATIAMADRVVTLGDADGIAAQRELLHVLELADIELAKRLAKITPKANGDMKFTAAQAISSRTQIAIVIAKTQHRLLPVATDVATAAMHKSLAEGAKILSKLEHDFKGVSVSPNILAAMRQSQVLHGPKATLATRMATSLDRYGLEMGQQFSRIIQTGLLSGATTDQMVASLVAHGGPRGKVSLAAREVAPGVVQRLREGDIPEGLFVRHKYWAERLIRTEVAYAFNGSKLEQLRVMRAEGLDVQKKICAHFDTRTAPDSVAVHGQIRELEATFIDGLGRVYLYPPGRPNDRETILPWFADWDETPSTKPPNPEEVKKAEELAQPQPKGAPLVPKTKQQLDQLEQEAQQAIQLAEQKRAGEASLTTPKPDPEEATRAAQVLKRIEEETRAKQLALQKLAEEQAAAAAKKAEAARIRMLNKVDRDYRAKVAKGDAHLVHLDLYDMATALPGKFAQVYNDGRHVPIPEQSIREMIKDPAMLKMLVGRAADVFERLGDLIKPSEQLDAFKRSSKFGAFVDNLADHKTAHSRKQLAALLMSEGETIAAAKLRARKDPLQIASELKHRYQPHKDYAERWREKYGHLAERMGAAERRMDEALGLTLEQAIERAKKLPKELGTQRYLEDLEGMKTLTISLRTTRTLGEMANAVAYGDEIRAHAALLGHVDGIDPVDALKLRGDPPSRMNRFMQKPRPERDVLELDQAATRGAEALAKLCDKSVLLAEDRETIVVFSPHGREACGPQSGGARDAIFMYLHPNTTIATAAHEYSHALDFRNFNTSSRTRFFLAQRSKGLTTKPLRELVPGSGYGSDERAFEAGFLSPYTGKDYGPFMPSNEVVAMGATHLFRGEVVKLYDKDPAHLFFTLSQYRGDK